MSDSKVEQAAALAVSAAAPEECVRIARFLTSVLGPDQAEFLQPPFLTWKYFDDRRIWPGGRSYVVRQREEIVAHAGIWPIAFQCSTRTIQMAHLIDWAADTQAAGAGATVYLHLMGLARIAIAIGGSADARRVLPKLGFKPYAVVREYARVIRPVRQFRIRPRHQLWRETARLARNTIWSMAPRRPAASGWISRAVRCAPDAIDTLTQPGSFHDFCPGVRSAALLNYFLACPGALCRLYTVMQNSLIRGYFLFNQVAGQCRIVDLFVNSEALDDWRALYRLALDAAAQMPETCEITTVTALPSMGALLSEEGFKLRTETPAVAYDPAGYLRNSPPLNLQMVDWDVFYRYDPSFPFLT